MSLQLIIRFSDGTRRTFDRDGLKLPCVIGRDSESAQLVINDVQASRAHCKIDAVDGGLTVEDLASRNGTWINNQRIATGVLRAGDMLRIGVTELSLVDTETDPPDPLVGKRLGGFELQEDIGRGRYGTVYRAMQVALGRSVAVKVLCDEYRKDPERVQAFLTEARRAGRLNHPHLVQVHDVCQMEDQYLLVMELMSHSVGDLINDEGPIDELTALRVVGDIAKALSYAESQRLVHRDVKPDNILVNDEGVYKLADLGIAMPLNEEGVALQERTFGSPHYVAPEQARGGAIDGRADLYALGASAWHMLTGKPIYIGTTRQIVSAHINSPLPDLRRLISGLMPGTVELVYALLKKAPDDRPENAAVVAQTIDHLIKRSATRSGARPLLVARARLRRIRRR